MRNGDCATLLVIYGFTQRQTAACVVEELDIRFIEGTADVLTLTVTKPWRLGLFKAGHVSA